MGKLLLILIALATACATTRPLTAELAEARTDSAKGKILYERSCSRCHGLYMPTSYAPEEWRFYVRKYGRRARLDPGEQGLVYHYLSGAGSMAAGQGRLATPQAEEPGTE